MNIECTPKVIKPSQEFYIKLHFCKALSVAVYSALGKWECHCFWPKYSINVRKYHIPLLFSRGFSFPLPFLFPPTMTSIE